jgi:hypothetical protein
MQEALLSAVRTIDLSLPLHVEVYDRVKYLTSLFVSLHSKKPLNICFLTLLLSEM